MKRIGWMLLMLGAFAATSARAELSATEFLQAIKPGQRNAGAHLLSLNGLANGFSWANSLLEQQRKTALYCTPQELVPTVDQLVDILRRFLEKPEYQGIGTFPYGMVMLTALQQTFPCRQ